MKVAVTATGPTLQDLVGAEFEEYLLIVELSTMDDVALINPAAIMSFNYSAAGQVLVQFLQEQDVKALLTNKCSTHTLKCLANYEIQAVLGTNGSAHTAVKHFKRMPMISHSVPVEQAIAEPGTRPPVQMWEEKANSERANQDQIGLLHEVVQP